MTVIEETTSVVPVTSHGGGDHDTFSHMRVLHIDADAVDEWVSAREARLRVCRRDCGWPLGDGECGYCRDERAAWAVVEASLIGGDAP